MITRLLVLMFCFLPIAALADDGIGHPILPPDQTPPISVNPEAPSAFRGLKIAMDSGNKEMKEKYADQYVRYMQRLMLEVREITQLIGEAMVRQGVVDEEDWVGVGQYLTKELAEARTDKNDMLSVTPEVALDAIKPDPNGKAEVYIFCSPSSRYCREMGPDIERLHRLTKSDPQVKFGFFMLGSTEDPRVKAFKEYTGISAPVQDGTALAKQFRIAFVPAVVVRSSSTNEMYLRTGVVPFARLFQLVRKVQGRPPILRENEMQVVSARIGLMEKDAASSSKMAGGVVSVDYSGHAPEQTIERF